MTTAVDAEPLLPDQRVKRIADRLMLRFPELPGSTEFVTAQRGPQFQFVVMCDYPRPHLAAMGTKLAMTAKGQVAGWREAEAERKRFVSGDEDPAYPVFAGLAWALVKKLRDMRSMIN